MALLRNRGFLLLWIGQLLGQLSTSQLRGAFRAAGYSQVDVTAFVQALQRRIEQLKAL